MYERTSGGRTVRVKCGRVVDDTPLGRAIWLRYKRLNPASKVPHITEVMDAFGERPSPAVSWGDTNLEFAEKHCFTQALKGCGF
jgi:hypothetical protein